MYVDQSESPLSIEMALGAVKSHLKAHGFHSYLFTMATLNERKQTVTVTVASSLPDRLGEFAARRIRQDYPDENL